MTTFTGPDHPTEQLGTDRDPVVLPSSRRGEMEVLGLLLGILSILLGLALTLGATLPFGP